MQKPWLWLPMRLSSCDTDKFKFVERLGRGVFTIGEDTHPPAPEERADKIHREMLWGNSPICSYGNILNQKAPTGNNGRKRIHLPNKHYGAKNQVASRVEWKANRANNHASCNTCGMWEQLNSEVDEQGWRSALSTSPKRSLYHQGVAYRLYGTLFEREPLSVRNHPLIHISGIGN